MFFITIVDRENKNCLFEWHLCPVVEITGLGGLEPPKLRCCRKIQAFIGSMTHVKLTESSSKLFGFLCVNDFWFCLSSCRKIVILSPPKKPPNLRRCLCLKMEKVEKGSICRNRISSYSCQCHDWWHKCD